MATSKSSPTPGETSGVGSPDAETVTNVEPVGFGTSDPGAVVSGGNAADDVVEVDTGVHLKDITGVRYLGRADVKSLAQRDLQNAGIEAKGDLVWNSSNDWFIDKSEINADTLHYLAAQSDFRAE